MIRLINANVFDSPANLTENHTHASSEMLQTHATLSRVLDTKIEQIHLKPIIR